MASGIWRFAAGFRSADVTNKIRITGLACVHFAPKPQIWSRPIDSSPVLRYNLPQLR
jgi:hypothetical protein